ncbi:MAG TPA: 3-oxoacyl-ACP synthase III family protein [Solirubrobacteraceae bacterium]|jgi:3-oxoacyl-[acyl-carrier-protein] synthase-3|nr:3-oxoacyl-ACP synthase III family protein [Solirubrobacteraceae bacterium]
MRDVQILATGSYLPGEALTNEQLAGFAGPLPDDVLEGIQVKTRHWIADPLTGEQSETNAHMAAEAGERALALAGVDAADVELIVVSTASPDYHLPGLSTFVQEALGLERCASVDIRSGCAGAIEALDLARMYLERGQYENALVIGSEAISPLIVPIFLGRPPEKVRMRDRLGIYSFGDGAGAMVLAPREGDGVRGSAIACVGGHRPPGMQVIGGGTHRPIHEQLQAKRLIELKVDVVESGRFTPFVLIEGLRRTLESAGLAAGEVDLCVIPEGNAEYITDELTEAGLETDDWTALQGRIFENLTLVGATGSAAVPLALDHAWRTGRLDDGPMVMLLAIETSKWKYGGWVFPWTAGPAPTAAG